ncbi:MAG: hypothetical protein ACTTH8_08965 [Treponema sp.]
MHYLIRNADISDITAIMHIEQASFADSIMESEAVFTERVCSAAPYTFVLCVPEHGNDAQQTVYTAAACTPEITAFKPEAMKEIPKEYSTADRVYTACGYFCAERWEERHFSPEYFALGHSAAECHCPAGSVLYISSFALVPALRGKKITAADRYTVLYAPYRGAASLQAVPSVESVARFFFRTVLDTISAAYADIERIVLIVHEEWTAAIRIYESQGFCRTGVIHHFAGFDGKCAFVYEKSLK